VVVLQAIAAAEAQGSPLSAVVRLALDRGRAYWAALAMDWIDAGFPAAGCMDSLGKLKDLPHLSQGLRHRAWRLWEEARDHEPTD
jgi:hypothetical protein